MSIDVDENLELLERQVPENGLVRVSKGTGTPFNIKLKPRLVTHHAALLHAESPFRVVRTYIGP